MRKLFELEYVLDIQLFSEEDVSKVDEPIESTQDGVEPKDDTVKLTSKQLNDRLERERKKAREEADKNISSKIQEAVAQALAEQEKKRIDEENFSKLNEKEKQEELARREREEIEKARKEIEAQRHEIQVIKHTDEIMTAYDNDKLPNRDLFKPVANLLAKASEQEKFECYNAIKEIIKQVETNAFQESLKQNPPKDGDSSNNNFASDKYIEMQNKEFEPNKNDVAWGKMY